MLHTVNKPPIKSKALQSALRVAAEGDPILLLEDGVLAARPGAVTEELVQNALAKHPIFALAPDLKARGIGNVIDGIQSVGYDGFVGLVEQHHVVGWT
jgi:tRNA 2-thiouridine synthesizing protein B